MGTRRIRCVAGRLGVLAAAMTVACASAATAMAETQAWSVLPPGNGYVTGLTAGDRSDQLRLYDGLDDPVADATLRDADLGRYYKAAALEVRPEEVRHRQTPRPGVVIDWDLFGVPYVTGPAATDVAYGAGWATAEARLLLAEISRALGRRGALELDGGDFFAALGAKRWVSYTEAELQAQLDLVVATDPVQGGAFVAELDAYCAGINDWIAQHPVHRLVTALLRLDTSQWRPTDAIASLLTVVGHGSTGGNELRNAQALRALAARFGDDGGRAAYDDLRAAAGPSTTHVADSVAYPAYAGGGREFDPAAVALPDAGATREPQPAGDALWHSNFVAVDAAHSATGHPILVGGPQNAITFPALLFEMVLRGGGFDARGAFVPGAGPYAMVGRSTQYAWTSTSGLSDQTDIRAELLCDPARPDGPAPPDATSYVHMGVCTPMTRPDSDPRTAWRSVHGPVVDRGTVGGRAVAFTQQRSSRGREGLAALAVRPLNRGEMATPEAFLEASRHITFSGNWLYADSDHIAYAHVGRYPVRAAGASADFPTWGTGEWEWEGTLDPDTQPRTVDPPSGHLVSWNNRVAPAWRTGDGDWAKVGPTRADLIGDRISGRTGLDLAAVISAHTAAGAADLRGSGVLPAVLAVLEGTPAPTPALEQVRSVLGDWSSQGAYRRDRNRDLSYDHPGVLLMDELWVPLQHAVFDGRYAGLYDVLQPSLDTGARNTGSSFGAGWYGHVVRDLDRVRTGADPGTGVPVACGGGELEACRADLWAALDTAHRRGKAAQVPVLAGDVRRWRAWTLDKRIWLLPYVFNLDSARWSNRPAYEMAIGFGP